MPGTGTEPGWQGGDARVLTGLVGFSIGNRGPDALYVLFALGWHSMTIEGARNPYSILWGTRLGVGLRWQMGRLLGRAELAPHLILSDYGTTELSPGTFWAAVGGVTF
jgi:hypothetical protein